MGKKYVQLPPLPLDLPLECIDMIWLYARTPRQEKEIFLEFMRKNTPVDTRDAYKTELTKMMNDSKVKLNPAVKEFALLMRQLLGTLIAQACEMSALVYQYY